MSKIIAKGSYHGKLCVNNHIGPVISIDGVKVGMICDD